MTTFEIILGAVVGGFIPILLYAAKYVNDLRKQGEETHRQLHERINELTNKLHELEVKSVAGDELTKKHILSCNNWEPRQEAKGLL